MQASLLESTFSFCHRLVLRADQANSLEAAAQVLPLTISFKFTQHCSQFLLRVCIQSTSSLTPSFHPSPGSKDSCQLLWPCKALPVSKVVQKYEKEETIVLSQQSEMKIGRYKDGAEGFEERNSALSLKNPLWACPGLCGLSASPIPVASR